MRGSESEIQQLPGKYSDFIVISRKNLMLRERDKITLNQNRKHYMIQVNTYMIHTCSVNPSGYLTISVGKKKFTFFKKRLRVITLFKPDYIECLENPLLHAIMHQYLSCFLFPIYQIIPIILTTGY